MRDFDAAVVGLGIMGSAVLTELANRDLRVIGIDRFDVPNRLGSSHGRTRLIREAYYEHPMYVPLVRRALSRWRELQHESNGERLLIKTGSLMIGGVSSELVRGTLQSAADFEIPHEVLESDTLHRQFPAFTPLDDMVGVWEPGSAILFPEPILELLSRLALARGAVIEPNVHLSAFEPDAEGVVLVTGTERLRARHLVLCAGAWLPELLPDLPLRIERQVMHWFEPARDRVMCGPDRMPVTLWQLGDRRIFYTMPDFGDGVKIGWHHSGETTTAAGVRRMVTHEETAEVVDLLRRFAPPAKGRWRTTEVCLYTNTPDGHFLIDRLPGAPNVHVVSACSGHGFKFAPAIAEIVADELTGATSSFDLTPFRMSRLQRAPS